MLMGNFAKLKGNHGLLTLFRPAQARALAVDRREEGQHAAHCSEIGAIPNRQQALFPGQFCQLPTVPSRSQRM